MFNVQKEGPLTTISTSMETLSRQFDVTALLAKKQPPKSLEIQHQPNSSLRYCTWYIFKTLYWISMDFLNINWWTLDRNKKWPSPSPLCRSRASSVEDTHSVDHRSKLPVPVQVVGKNAIKWICFTVSPTYNFLKGNVMPFRMMSNMSIYVAIIHTKCMVFCYGCRVQSP